MGWDGIREGLEGGRIKGNGIVIFLIKSEFKNWLLVVCCFLFGGSCGIFFFVLIFI